MNDYNVYAYIVLALLNLATLWLTRRTNKNMVELEKNTNSKMDALLLAKIGEATAKGTAIGLQQGRDESKAEIEVEEPLKVEIVKVPDQAKTVPPQS